MRVMFFYIGVLGFMICNLGCGKVQLNEKVIVQENLALKELATKAGIVFPSQAVVVNSGDGGGRDASYGFYFWAVFSQSQIKLPAMQGAKAYLNLPLSDTIKFVEGAMSNRKVSQPSSAICSEWETNGYTFQGTLVRSSDGDYLVIQQFRKK